jgi:cysteinyl-tRNA synthetase
VALHIYDTLARRAVPFEPVQPGEASIYVCGATPQSAPHVGHLRSSVSFDVLHRWLAANGYKVHHVVNVTDIDDKILTNAVKEDLPWFELSAKYEREFQWAYAPIGNVRPSIEPRATGHVTQMVDIIDRLIKADLAYEAAGSVWFAVRKFPDYGRLSGQKIDEMLDATDPEPGKRDPLDFALWKGAKPDEPGWPTPWGYGRPGWHIECSAMATAYLGKTFDFHGGGRDLAFPHHENERAQSLGAGDGFARYWMHNAWVTTSGEKMSKSLGNSLQVKEIIKIVRPIELRYYLLAPHYRSNIEMSDLALEEAGTAFRRIESFITRATELTGDVEPSSEWPAAFVAALDDDLGTPAAVALIHDLVREGNSLVGAGDSAELRAVLATVRGMLAVLGLDPLSEHWVSHSDGAADAALDRLVSEVLARREAARVEKQWPVADAFRDSLAAAGIKVEDTPNGQRWSLATSDD